ncbi:MAG: hypothetical protein RLZZ200_2139, partial [Pseudomonadota bacterium]
MSALGQVAGLGGAVALLVVVIAAINRRRQRAQENRIVLSSKSPAPEPAFVVDTSKTLTSATDGPASPGTREIQRRLYALAFDGANFDEPGRVPAGGHALQA